MRFYGIASYDLFEGIIVKTNSNIDMAIFR